MIARFGSPLHIERLRASSVYDVHVNPPYQIRSDISRVVRSGFEFPLGIESVSSGAIQEGYSVDWVEGGGDGPDTFTFFVVLSHSRLSPLLHDLFALLPEQVSGIVEMGSRDAFRSVDIFLGERPISCEGFLDTWQAFEDVFLEDTSLAVGVNADAPFMEIFLDQDKRVTIHVEPGRREDVEAVLSAHELAQQESNVLEMPDSEFEQIQTRSILVEDPSLLCDIDQLLLVLRHEWALILDEDEDRNLDSGGRELGRTLWHSIVLVQPSGVLSDGFAHAVLWACASSRRELEQMVRDQLAESADWVLRDFYTLDRVAFDDRPEELASVAPKHPKSEIFMFQIDEHDGFDMRAD